MDHEKRDALLARIHIVESEQAASDLITRMQAQAKEKPLRIAFVNAHAYNLCCENEDFLDHLLECDYVFRDGAGMKILFTLMGREAGVNMNGTDFIPKLLGASAEKTIALMGTDSPYLEKAAAAIEGMGLRPVIVKNGFHEAGVYIDLLKEKQADIVLLAMGMPKQEHVASLVAKQIAVPMMIVCGGAILDFIGGKVARAPVFYQKIGMEWAYRLYQEPRRLFGRYVIGNAVFLTRAVTAAFQPKMPVEQGGPLKILHVVRQYDPAIGGLESYVKSMAAHQKKQGAEIEILTLNTVFHGDGAMLPERETIDGISVRRVGFWGRRRFFIPRISPFYFRRFDIVHVHNTDVFFDYVGLAALLLRFPAFATTHGGFFHTKDFSLFKTVYFNIITRITALGYKALFAISQNDHDRFAALNKNVLLFPNAVEPLGDEMTKGRDFLYIGRLAQHKNIPQMLKVYARLKHDHGVSGKLHILGPAWDVSIESLHVLSRDLKIEDDVVFHGAASHAAMKDTAAACGYFLSASAFEGFGMSMIEGMSIGLIPFVHNNESFTELVNKSGVGLALSYDNPDDAARKIAEMLPSLTDGDRRKAMSFAAGYAWPDLTQKTLNVYTEYKG